MVGKVAGAPVFPHSVRGWPRLAEAYHRVNSCSTVKLPLTEPWSWNVLRLRTQESSAPGKKLFSKFQLGQFSGDSSSLLCRKSHMAWNSA